MTGDGSMSAYMVTDVRLLLPRFDACIGGGEPRFGPD
jgi:hypothetical protein